MLEEVNINVQQTIQPVNVVASAVTEEVNIDVYETKEEVSINVTEEIIRVNVNKVDPSPITRTSQLINDGEDGDHQFITVKDIPDLGYTPENSENKSTSIQTDQASDSKYPTVKSVYDWASAVFTTASAVSSQISTALAGYATQSWVSYQGYITSVIGSLGYTPAKQVIQLTPITLNAASWSLAGGFYTYTFSNVNITSTSVVDFTPDNASINEVSSCRMLPQVDVANGNCTFYATFPPQSNIIGTINIWQ